MKDEDAMSPDASLEAKIRSMDDPSLQRLGSEYASLTDQAQTLVRAEYARRSLEVPLTEERVEGEPEGVVVLRQYRDPAEAALARSVLESAGITCFLRDENTVRIDWLWSNLMGGIRLQVAESDVEVAEALLSQPIPETIAMEGQPDFQQPTCPQCQSLDISFETIDAKVGATSILLFGFPLPSPVTKDFWHCHSCGCNWTGDGEGQETTA